MNLQALSASLHEQGVKHRVVIAKPEASEESKLREFFEHFINVFPKFRLWNVKDLKAGAKYGLTTIKPFLAGEVNQAQLIPMRYQVNPVLTVEKFPQSETHAQAKKLVREIYGPHLKKTLDVVYGVRAGLHPIETKDEYGAVVEFEDAGKPMRATLKITAWSDHGDETELAIYVTINNRRASAKASHSAVAATTPEKIAEDKALQGKFQQEVGAMARSVGFTDVSSFVIDISKNHNTCYAVALYLKPYLSSGGQSSYKMILRRDKDTITEYDPDMIAGQHGMSKAKLGSFKMSKLHKELEGIFVDQGK